MFLFEKKKMQNRRRRRLRGPRPQRPLPRPHRRRRARPGACGFLLGTAAVLRRARGAELAAPAPRCEEKRERVFFFLKERRRVFFRRRSAPRGRRKKETHFFPLFFFFFLTKRNKTGAPGLEGAHEVIGGVYAGGLPSANSLVSSGGAAAGAFRLLSGYAGWEPGQLAAEAERGAWHVVAASTAVVLDAVQGKKERVCFPFFFSSLYLFSPRLQRKNPCPRAPFFSLFPSPFFFSFSLSVFFSPDLTSPRPSFSARISHRKTNDRPPPRRPRHQGEGRHLGLHHGAGGHRPRRPRRGARRLRLYPLLLPGLSSSSSEQRQEEERREGTGALGVRLRRRE